MAWHGSVDCDESPNTCLRFNITVHPTIIFLQHGWFYRSPRPSRPPCPPISPATVPHTPTGTHSMHTLSHSRAGTPRQSYARAHSHSRAQEHIVSPYVGGTLGLPDGLSAGDFPVVAIAAKSPRRRCSASPARRRATGRTRSRRPRFIRSVAARADSSAVAASLCTQVPKEASSSFTPTAVCHAHHQIRHGSTVAVQLFALSIPT